MRFEADLDILIDGAVAHVRGDGATLVVESSHPRALVADLRRVPTTHRRRQWALVAEGLAARGASVHVQGPHGRVATVGADADSAASGLLAGTRRLHLSWRTWIVSSVADAVAGRRRLVVAGVVVAALTTAAVVVGTNGRA